MTVLVCSEVFHHDFRKKYIIGEFVIIGNVFSIVA